MFIVEIIPEIQNDIKQCSTNKQIWHSKYGNWSAMDGDDDDNQDERDDWMGVRTIEGGD